MSFTVRIPHLLLLFTIKYTRAIYTMEKRGRERERERERSEGMWNE